MNRMGTSYNEILAQRAQAVDLPSRITGSSGYFSKPTPSLDPRLFPAGSDHLYPQVRRLLLHYLYAFWQHNYNHPEWWSTAWIAGSGITRQWSGGRAVGNAPGDLDVLIGVDFATFFQANPNWRGTPDDTMAGQFNDEFRAGLWPQTAALTLPTGGAPFEVTFYVNPNSSDIRNIHPYAAYNLTEDEWTVHPISLPEDWDPITHFPTSWWDNIHAERAVADHLLNQFHVLRSHLNMQRPGTGTYINDASALHDVVRRASDLFDSIHGERHQAFGPGGSGYMDYYNFRWQASKYLGHVQALHQLAKLDSEVHKDVTQECSGPIIDAQHALQLAVKAVAQGL